ncbi:glycosyltransferase family 2 protein [Halogeometricum limi]|uniref:Glycosyl transferase family 2 n=1 Tax=Halogeometricum limi TaxID=555875 RepID=A0A1I6HTL3_9EURY|nr:glycosyltransferase [Halogeometricum limi]SFR57796.1 Glycosyl transferase family 2 [Halogeometricum limi]
MTVLVSAVIPTYNRESYVGGAIESVLEQTYENVEVVVVNDGSTDGTESVLAEYADDDRVRVLRNDENRGIPYTMNRGVEAARGDYIGVFGDDDRWYPTKVEKQVAVLEGLGDDYCGVYTGGVIRDGSGEVVDRVRWDRGGDRFPEILVRNTVLPHSSHLVRAECFEAVGGFDESFDIACDWDLTIRLSKRWKWACIPEELVERTHHDGNVTGDPDYDVRCRAAVREKYAAELAANPDARRRFEAAAHRERGVRALEADDRTEAVRELSNAFVRERRGDHAALLALAPFGPRALSAARALRGVRG